MTESSRGPSFEVLVQLDTAAVQLVPAVKVRPDAVVVGILADVGGQLAGQAGQPAAQCPAMASGGRESDSHQPHSAISATSTGIKTACRLAERAIVTALAAERGDTAAPGAQPPYR